MLKFVLIFLFGNCVFAQTVSTYFSDPSTTITDAITFDASGNLYGSDFFGDSVYKATPTGNLTTFVSGLENPNGLAFDSEGNLYVVEYSGGKIHKYDSAGTLITSYTVSGIPSGMIKAFDSDDMIFTMVDNHSVNRLSTGTGTITELYQGAPLDTPVGLAYDDSGNLYTGNYIGRQIYKITTTATYVATVPDGGADSFLAFIAYGNGTLFGSIFFEGHKIYTINPNAIDDTTLFAGSVQGNTDGDITVATFDSPSGLAFVPSENALYISEFSSSGNVRKIDGIPLSVTDFSSGFQVVLSPNPSSNMLQLIGTAENYLGNIDIHIYNTAGKLVQEWSKKTSENTFDIHLDVSKLSSGLYTIHLQSDRGRTIAKKFVKK